VRAVVTHERTPVKALNPKVAGTDAADASSLSCRSKGNTSSGRQSVWSPDCHQRWNTRGIQDQCASVLNQSSVQRELVSNAAKR
jgi:hypothetical protein